MTLFRLWKFGLFMGLVWFSFGWFIKFSENVDFCLKINLKTWNLGIEYCGFIDDINIWTPNWIN